MKYKYTLCFLSLVLSAIGSPLFAQLWTSKVDNTSHHLYVVGKGGVNSFLYKADDKNAQIKIGGSIGLQYDFYFLKFMGIGTGIEFSFLRSQYNMGDKSYQIESIDNDPMAGGGSESFIFGADIQNAKVTQSATYIYIPLMLRFRFHHFYMGVGAKAGVFLGGNYSRNIARLKTYGIYEDLYGPIEDVPEHGFVNESAVGSEGRWNLKTDWTLSFDFGIKFRTDFYSKKKKSEYPTIYMGVYIDYGLNNLHKESQAPTISEYPVVYNFEEKGCLQYNAPINITSSSLNIHSLSAGLKLAIGLNLK